MKKVSGINLRDIFNKPEIQSRDDIALLEEGLSLRMGYITCILDKYSKDILKEIVTIITNEIKDEHGKDLFLRATEKYMYGLSFFNPGVFVDKDEFFDFLVKMLIPTKVFNDSIEIDGNHIYTGDYIFFKNSNISELFKIRAISDDRISIDIVLTGRQVSEFTFLSYAEFKERIDMEKTILYKAASVDMADGNAPLWMYESEIEYIINDYSNCILDERTRNKFKQDSLDNTINLKQWHTKHRGTNIINIILDIWNKYNLDKRSIYAKGRTFYVGSYVVMDDMECKYDTVISSINDETVCISNKFNSEKNVRLYTIEEFQEKVSILSDFNITANYNPSQFKKEYLPLLLAEHMFYINNNEGENRNISINSDIYAEGMKEFLEYRISDIPDRKRADAYVNDILKIISGKSVCHKGIWQEQSVIELIDYEWYHEKISGPSINMLGGYFYEGDAIGIREYKLYREVEITTISDGEIVIAKRFHPEHYTKSFKTAEELADICLNINDAIKVEDKLSNDKTLLENEALVREYCEMLLYLGFNYRFGSSKCTYVNELAPKLRQAYVSYHKDKVQKSTPEELKYLIIRYLLEKKNDVLNQEDYNEKNIKKVLVENIKHIWYRSGISESILYVKFEKNKVALAEPYSYEPISALDIDDFINSLIEVMGGNKQLSLEDNLDTTEEVVCNIQLSFEDNLSVIEEVVNISREEVLSSLILNIYTINQCEHMNFNNSKNTNLFVKSCSFDEKVFIDLNKNLSFTVAKDIKKKIFLCETSNDKFEFDFKVVVEELKNYKNPLLEQLDLFVMI